MGSFNLVSSLLAMVLLLTHHVHAGSPDLVIPLLGSDPCTWGPSYWCANEENMKRCGVTKGDCETYADDL
ncbi:hypothetical protein FGRMN_6980 [Fusarium graminum]|nr:hypothetical protein FGRMN_6980 [Fusarium graminum]